MNQQEAFELISPPLRFCMQIPKGEFTNTALRWYKVGGVWRIDKTELDLGDLESYPAPTVQEIWRDLASPKRHNVYEMELSEPLAYVVRYMKCDGLDEDHQPINEKRVQFIGDFMDDSCTTMLKAWFTFHGYELKDERIKK
jgi:hypothetical protein